MVRLAQYVVAATAGRSNPDLSPFHYIASPDGVIAPAPAAGDGHTIPACFCLVDKMSMRTADAGNGLGHIVKTCEILERFVRQVPALAPRAVLPSPKEGLGEQRNSLAVRRVCVEKRLALQRSRRGQKAAAPPHGAEHVRGGVLDGAPEDAQIREEDANVRCADRSRRSPGTGVGVISVAREGRGDRRAVRPFVPGGVPHGVWQEIMGKVEGCILILRRRRVGKDKVIGLI